MISMSCTITRTALYGFSLLSLFLVGCAEVSAPDARNVNIPTPITADKRQDAINERPDGVMYLPLGEDILVPERIAGHDLPDEVVGPFELRSETLAGALQLILAEYDVAIAFETNEGLDRRVTVTNLKGPLDKLVQRVCSLADLYCSYEDGAIVVKDTQTFTVSLPPLATADGETEFIDDIIQGLTAIIGNSGIAPVSDPTTRTLIYSATQRTATLAANYFQRLRANTALIVFETYIWEVSLDSGNSTGIDWSSFDSFGKFNTSIGINGSVDAGFGNPVSIGLPTTSAIGASPTQLVEFLSTFGAVKTISQPQLTVLSGSRAELRVADTENYVSEVTSTISGDQTSTSVSTDSVDSGFTLGIGSSWDKSTVYANVAINLTNVVTIDDFTFSDSGTDGTDTIIQLPQTTERELTTQIRIRPGDSVLIGGLVRETDNFDSRGPGFMEPIIPDSRTAQTSNLELVILLRPRVVVYTDAQNQRYKEYIEQKTLELRASKARPEWVKSNSLAPETTRRSSLVSPSMEAQESVSEPVVVPTNNVQPSPIVKEVVEVETLSEIEMPKKQLVPVVEQEPRTIVEETLPEPITLVPAHSVEPLETEVLDNLATPPVVDKVIQDIVIEPVKSVDRSVSLSQDSLAETKPYIPYTSSINRTGYVSQSVHDTKSSINQVVPSVRNNDFDQAVSGALDSAVQPPVPAQDSNIYEEFEAGNSLFSQ